MFNVSEYFGKITFGVASVLLEVEGPNIAQVAALSREVEAGCGYLRRGIFTDNVIVLCHNVTEELGVLSDFYQGTLSYVII